MKIAFGTDDKLTITKRQFEESLYYSVYEILNGQIFSQQIRDNPYLQNFADESKNCCLKVLEDCDIFIGRDMNNLPLSELADKNVEVISSTLDSIEDAVNSFLNSEEKYFRYYNPKEKQFTDFVAILKN